MSWKSHVEALNRYEKQMQEEKRKWIRKKYSSSPSRQSSDTEPNTKLVFVSREPLLHLEFNRPNKQNVHEIILFKKFNFSQSQMIVDTLINIGNETSKPLLKIDEIRKPPNSAFRCECYSPFQGTAKKEQLATAHGQLCHSWKVFPILFKTDLSVTNHIPHKFSPSLTVLSDQNWNRLPGWTKPQVLRAYFFNSCNVQGNT